MTIAPSDMVGSEPKKLPLIVDLDGEKVAERKPIELKAGQSKVLTFERGGLAPGAHQAEITPTAFAGSRFII